MNTRPLLFAASLLLLNLSATAQEKSFSGIRSITYGGVGLISPSPDMKTLSMIDNGVDFRFGHFQSLFRKNLSKGALQLGLELRLNYSKFDYNLQPASSISNIRYNNGTPTPAAVVLKLESKTKKPDAFHYLIGPSAVFSQEKFFLGASLLVGYASVAQEAFRYYDSIQNTANPAQNRNIDFYSGTHETNNGFVFSPGVKAGFRITRHLAFFVAADYSFGSKQDFVDRIFVPAGNPTNGVYDFQQLRNGTTADRERYSQLRALMLSGNLALTIPHRK
ncbi:MAG TPA: hypothetical protein VFR58_18500 [Flavisolibacter sp.]|nr:hypothetical protein [Flavisolibacter sp.]